MLSHKQGKARRRFFVKNSRAPHHRAETRAHYCFKICPGDTTLLISSKARQRRYGMRQDRTNPLFHLLVSAFANYLLSLVFSLWHLGFSLAPDPWPSNLDLLVLSYPISSYLVLRWFVFSSCHLFSCLVMSCRVLSCLVLSWLGFGFDLFCHCLVLSWKNGNKRIQGGNGQGSGIRTNGHTRSQRGNAEWRKTGENVVLYCSRISIWWLFSGCLCFVLVCLVLSCPVIVLYGEVVFLVLLYCPCHCLFSVVW